jgi:2',3'-cyclic-nucleotide 3'-phosphodiesterase
MGSENKDLGLSLWLIPPESFKPAPALSKLTTTTFPTSPNFPQSPPFPPHITLTSSIPASTQLLLPSLALESITPPKIEFDELGHGDAYFKFIFLRIKESTTLLSLVKYVRERLLPNVSAFDERLYDPHISLVYSKGESTEKQVEYVAQNTNIAIGSSTGWTGGKIMLVDTRSSNVDEWKIVEEWTFPEIN